MEHIKCTGLPSQAGIAAALLHLALLAGAAPAAGSPLAQSVLSTSNSNTALDPYPNKPRLTFGPSGTFKLTIFSDLHFGENPGTKWGPRQDINSLKLMHTVLVDETPDYVVINGDLITGENTYRENSTDLVDMIVRPLNEVGVPFSTSFGNHDNQKNISHREEILRQQSISPLCYTRLAPENIGGRGGEGNYWVPIYENAKDLRPALVIWFFDSRGGWSPGDTSSPLPDWVDASVAGWIQRETSTMDAAWGAAESTGRAALAFVHIPPHAIEKVSKSLNETTNPGLNADALGQGSTQASDNPKSMGRDRPFWDALNTHVKNLRAIISGHGQSTCCVLSGDEHIVLILTGDHGNEWCAREPTKDVIFCFNKHSGYGGYDREGWGHGVRNMVFSPTALNKSLETWIRLEDGHTRARVTLDDAYGR